MKTTAAICLLVSVVGTASPQATFQQPPIGSPEWTQPYAPFRVAGNLYYVGTYDLAVYLITTPKGNIIINTGVAGSGQQIRANIAKLGFKVADTKILLATHAHWDHVSDLGELKRSTGAKLMMSAADAPTLEHGGPLGQGAQYESVKVDRRLKDGDTVQLGDVTITAHAHPGHTPGATSFTFVTRDNARSYRVLVVNMGSVVSKLVGNTDYPTIQQDYERTFPMQKQLEGTFDIWVSSHASQFDLHQKHQPTDAYRPQAFMDDAGYAQAIKDYEQGYREELAREKTSH